MITFNSYSCFPLWEDIIQSTAATALAGLDSATVEIYKGEDVLLFSGVVKKRPGDSDPQVRVNDIVAPYVRAPFHLPPETQLSVSDEWNKGWVPEGEGAAPGAMPLFKIVWQGGTLVRRFYVFGDWSYENIERDVDTPGIIPGAALSAPIDGAFVEGQFLVWTDLVSAAGIVYAVEDGDVTEVESIVKGDGDGEAGPSTYFARVLGFPGTTDKFELGVRYLKEGGYTEYSYASLKRIDSCSRYVLYYLNAYGGWDWFVVRGKSVESDDIEREEYARRASTSRRDRMTRGRDVLHAEITRRLELHTHWLTDEEAGRMHHLTESVSVFVHDLVEDIVYPAVMTGTSHEFKTYKNQGNRLVSYTLDLEIATPLQRQ